MIEFEGRNRKDLEKEYRDLKAAANVAYDVWCKAEEQFALDALKDMGLVPPCRATVKTTRSSYDVFIAGAKTGRLLFRKIKKDGTMSMVLLHLYGPDIKEILPHGAGEKGESQNG